MREYEAGTVRACYHNLLLLLSTHTPPPFLFSRSLQKLISLLPGYITSLKNTA